MTVLVVGSSGQLAQSLAHLPPHRDFDVVTLGRPDLDLESPQSIKAAVKSVRPSTIINAAAYTAVDQAEDEVEKAFAINRDGPAALATLCSAQGIPLIHVSTDYVFDGEKKKPYVEQDPTSPLGVYGASKLAGEVEVAKETPRHLIVRTSWVFSPYGKNFAKTMLNLAAEREEISVVADQYGSPTYAAHLARALIKMAEKVASGECDAEGDWGVFHLCGAGATSWHGFAEQIFELSKSRGGPHAAALPIETKDFPTKTQRPKNSQLDCSKAKKCFGTNMPPWQDAAAQWLSDFTAIQQNKG